jgi:murein DD-endopeptidase MepM/ murein hydrolase activator NlpD
MLFKSRRASARLLSAGIAAFAIGLSSGCTLYDNAVYGNRPGTVELPGSGADPNQPAIYVVASGDTVEAIGRRFNVPPQNIIERNSLKPPYRIVAGQWLELPGRSGSYAPVAAGYAGSDDRTAPGGNAPPGKPAAVQVQQLAPPPGSSAPPPPPSAPPPSTTQPAPGAPTTIGAAPGNKPTVTTPPPGPPPATSPPPQIASNTGAPKFDWPLRGSVVLGFGPHAGGVQNDGINIAAAKGTPVKAAEGGSVLYAGDEVKGFGKLVLIGHADGYVTAYANNDELLVTKGQRVTKGMVIAKVGQTGNVTSPQLHFEIRQKNKPVDPTTLLGS